MTNERSLTGDGVDSAEDPLVKVGTLPREGSRLRNMRIEQGP